MKRLHTIFPFALAFLSLLLVSGCGSSESQPALTKAEFIKKGDAICRKVDEKQEAGLKTYPKSHRSVDLNTKEGEEKVVLAVGLPPILTAADELEQLGPPAADKEKIEAIVKGLRQGVAMGKKDPLAVAEGTSNPFSEPDRLAAAYGFKACSQAL